MRNKIINFVAIIFIIPFLMLFNFYMLSNHKTVNEVERLTYFSENNSEDDYEVQQVKMLAVTLKVKGEYDENIKSTPMTCKTQVDRMTKLIYIDEDEEIGFKYIVYKQPAGELMVPTKKGWDFVQWTNIDGEVIDENSIIASTVDYPIYANWNIRVSELTVDPNNGTWNENIGEQSFSMAYSSTKEIEDPTRVGYTFSHWDLTGEDSTIEEKVFTMGTEDALLRAIWDANEYTLTVDPNGGIWNGTSNITKKTIEYDSITTIPPPTRTGYTFTGWTVSAGELDGTEFFMNYAGDVTLTANWTINSYKYIVYHNQQSIDGTAYNKVAEDTETGEKNYGTVISPNIKSYTGFTSPSRQSLTIQDDTDPPVKNIVNYNYARNKYILTVSPNGGTWNGTTANSTVSIFYEQTYTVANPTRTGYNFNNWTKTNNDSTLVDRVFKMGLSNTTLTANWTPKTYTLTYHVNGGNSINPSSKTITYDQAYGTLPTPTKPGYRFLGWYTALSGGTQVTSSTVHKTDGNVTIYAHWQNTAPVISSISVSYRYGTSEGLLTSGYEYITITVRSYDAEDGYPSSVRLACTSGTICTSGSLAPSSSSAGVYTFNITARNYGVGTFVITSTDSTGLYTKSDPQIMYVYGPGGALSDTVGYTNTTYDSGWFDVLDSCYISNFSFSVQFAYGHNNSSTTDRDVMVAVGRREDGSIVQLYWWAGNMQSTPHESDLVSFNTYNTSSNRIRQIAFYTYSPHNDCARSAVIKYSIEYAFDRNLINSRYSPISGSAQSTVPNIKNKF